jgi:hypothetical protein
MGVVSLWTPLAFERIASRWFTLPNILWLWPVPVLAAATALMLWRWLDAGRDVPPFLAAIFLFLLGYIGLVISSYPYIVPPSLTVWEAAAAPASLMFMLVGTVVLLPLVLGYTAFVYWLFRGKVRAGEEAAHLRSLTLRVDARRSEDRRAGFVTPVARCASLCLQAHTDDALQHAAELTAPVQRPPRPIDLLAQSRPVGHRRAAPRRQLLEGQLEGQLTAQHTVESGRTQGGGRLLEGRTELPRGVDDVPPSAHFRRSSMMASASFRLSVPTWPASSSSRILSTRSVRMAGASLAARSAAVRSPASLESSTRSARVPAPGTTPGRTAASFPVRAVPSVACAS